MTDGEPDDYLAAAAGGGDASGDDTTVRCRECGQTFGQITNSHLRTRHGMDISEYTDEHPGAPLSPRTSDAGGVRP